MVINESKIQNEKGRNTNVNCRNENGKKIMKKVSVVVTDFRAQTQSDAAIDSFDPESRLDSCAGPTRSFFVNSEIIRSGDERPH